MSLLTRAPIELTPLLAEVASPERGGTCVFLGTVRPDRPAGAPGPAVRAIDYSCYETMAEAEWARIVDEANTRWPEARTAARHRVGPVGVGEASIAIAVAAPHRAEAFAACRYAIEAVKARLPVWKRAECADGSVHWVGAPAPQAP